ncbi:MAG: type IV toxin-antitoxin system AbiEi family antitoxin domain-containing protein [Bacteroidales bacterium]|nr:type IV toxin-antitoxin system AbiEi family antitoxin domain-containing protein [Bacteroidales bacterium]
MYIKAHHCSNFVDWFSRGDEVLNEAEKKMRSIFSEHDFVMTTAELMTEKIYYADIQQLLHDGLIEKVRRGYYHWIDDFDGSEVVIINRLFPDAVLCMETALFYYKYSDRNPHEWNITIDKNTSRQRTKIDYPFIKAYRVEPSLLTIGETEGEIDDIEVRIYDRDRTICDVLRNMSKMDKEIFNKSIQNYVRDPKKNIPNLMEYSKALRVQKRVKDLIGVWL